MISSTKLPYPPEIHRKFTGLFTVKLTSLNGGIGAVGLAAVQGGRMRLALSKTALRRLLAASV